jgi:DNA-binding cell septation regulator SpoVG
MSVRVDVVKIRPIQGKGNLKGFASVQIAGKVTIHSCRIVQQPGQAPWVSLPQEEYTDREGKKRYSPMVEIPDEWKEPLSHAVLDAFSQHEMGNTPERNYGGFR